MTKKHSQALKNKMSAGQKDSWSDPTKRVEQKKRLEAKKLLALKEKKLLKDTTEDIIEPPGPLNIENARQALIDEMKKLDEQLTTFEPMAKRRDKLSSILEELNALRKS